MDLAAHSGGELQRHRRVSRIAALAVANRRMNPDLIAPPIPIFVSSQGLPSLAYAAIRRLAFVCYPDLVSLSYLQCRARYESLIS